MSRPYAAKLSWFHILGGETAKPSKPITEYRDRERVETLLIAQVVLSVVGSSGRRITLGAGAKPNEGLGEAQALESNCPERGSGAQMETCCKRIGQCHGRQPGVNHRLQYISAPIWG